MMGQVDQADQEIGFAIRRFPGNPRYYLSRAYIWLARSEFKKALDDVLKSKEMGMEVDDGFIDMIREQVNAAPSAPAAGPQPR
jgi:hypothetical protein